LSCSRILAVKFGLAE